MSSTRLITSIMKQYPREPIFWGVLTGSVVFTALATATIVFVDSAKTGFDNGYHKSITDYPNDERAFLDSHYFRGYIEGAKQGIPTALGGLYVGGYAGGMLGLVPAIALAYPEISLPTALVIYSIYKIDNAKKKSNNRAITPKKS